jgi:hypothetical protein
VKDLAGINRRFMALRDSLDERSRRLTAAAESTVLRRYEQESDRLFSDTVFDANLPDFEFANAFLLGLDMRALALATTPDLSIDF